MFEPFDFLQKVLQRYCKVQSRIVHFLHNAMTDYLFVLQIVACLQKKNTEDKTKIVLPIAQGSTSDITPRAMAMENNHDAKIYDAL